MKYTFGNIEVEMNKSCANCFLFPEFEQGLCGDINGNFCENYINFIETSQQVLDNKGKTLVLKVGATGIKIMTANEASVRALILMANFEKTLNGLSAGSKVILR